MAIDWQALYQVLRPATLDLPSNGRLYQDAVGRWAMRILGMMFAHHATTSEMGPENFAQQGEVLAKELTQFLTVFLGLGPAQTLTETFFAQLPALQSSLKHDAEAMEQGDPAATSVDEVIWCYPGFLALGLYRQAHY